MSAARRPVTLRAPQTARLLGFTLLIANCVLLTAFDLPFERVLRHETFDIYQRWFPRERTDSPVVVVEIDERSLREIGPWPWPRTRPAQLVERLVVAGPAVIAIDALFIEPDRYSPESLIGVLDLPPAAEAPMRRHLPDSDGRFEAALRASPVVLGAAGVTDAPTRTGRQPPLREYGGDPRAFVPHYDAVLSSLPLLVEAARGEALLNGEPERGVYRRLPTLATTGTSTVDATLMPGLAIETLRLASGGDPLLVDTGDDGLRRVGVAGIGIPVDRDGGWWIHFSPRGERPTLSAADVIQGTADPASVAGRIVLVGYTALGLQDIVSTPIGRMPGPSAARGGLDRPQPRSHAPA